MQYLTIVLLATSSVVAKYFTYRGYKVYRVAPINKDQWQSVVVYERNRGFDFWSTPRTLGHAVDVMVKPSAQKKFHDRLQEKRIPHVVLIANVSALVKKERREQMLAGRITGSKISFEKYNSYSEIMSYLNRLALKYHNLVTVKTVGTSYEGRDLKVIQISTHSNASKPIIFIDAGMHGREWGAHALALYIIHQLVEHPRNAKMLEKVDWHILPVVNPDGYEFSHAKRRFWRKNRSRGRHCYGVDINRNFNFHWAEDEGEVEECSNNYRGARPFSEPEAQTLRDYILQHKDAIKLYLTMHTYGAYILYPWGYTTDLPEDDKELKNLGFSVSKAINRLYGTNYWVGTTYNIMYRASGTTTDWAKAVAGVNLSYLVELRRGGYFGFNPPPKDILPIVKEAWAGIKVFHKYVAQKFDTPDSPTTESGLRQTPKRCLNV